MAQNPVLILIDGSSYLFRAFHALPSLTTSKGQPTGAIYGVINMLRKLLDEYQPQYIAVVFDAKGKTFRHELFEQYKAHRPPMPEELACQIQPLHDLIRALGLPLLCMKGVEADDVIGTLARQATAQRLETLISSGDKDLAQLVNPHVNLVNTMNLSKLDPAGVKAKFNVSPEQIVDYLALVGDTVDNIPGIPGVGPKTAAKLLCQYHSLDQIMAYASDIKGKMGENLRSHLPQLPLAKQLATIRQDVSLDWSPKELQRAPPNISALRELYAALEFKSWLRELLDNENSHASTPHPSTNPAPAYETVFSEESLEHWIARLKTTELFAFDLETNSLDYMEAEIVGLSFAIQPHEAMYIPLGHEDATAPPQLPREQVLARLKPLLEDPRHGKVGQNLKFDRNVLANYGIELQGIHHDSMLESYVLDSTATRHNMDSLALKYLQRTTITYEMVAGKGSKQLPFNQVTIEKAAPYAAEDADISLQLHRYFWPRIQQEESLRRLYQELEIPLIPVLSRMERNGVQVDTTQLKTQSDELAARLKKLEQEAFDLAGESFNLASPKQIQAILYEKLKLPVTRKTPTGQPSTAETVLQELALDYPLPQRLLQYRTLSKLKSTYTDRLPLQVNPHTGRVHTSYHQAVTATGRLSSSDPNLQNIPIRTAEGRRIRQTFIAPPGYRLVAADYSQIELRIMAHLSEDEGLLAAFEAEEDIHQRTATEVFRTPLEEVTPEQRRSAKAINFGLIYGMSAHGLGRQLGINRTAAQHYIERYFQRYPGVKAYMDNICQQARQKGYVETLFGRRLYLPDIHSRQTQRRNQAERTAINAPMQGSAADIIKRAMIHTDGWLQKNSDNARMIMQVHDELVFEVAEDKLEITMRAIRENMTAAAQLKIPLIVEIGSGANWDEAH
ncbi:DNA polymerase I [Nitrosococcus watsonii]|uniref:DNA polymerase I n=1 Tax=Nitrosococcus watsoni (strain C-113) TaxID=105559 RepID=D8KB11_NITWC|nr:DNA polymerase I [Nitrosococcus watsonii]ADJ27545.1 DNA polymerase I [Nitrosococcus watsonii C-113]